MGHRVDSAVARRETIAVSNFQGSTFWAFPKNASEKWDPWNKGTRGFTHILGKKNLDVVARGTRDFTLILGKKNLLDVVASARERHARHDRERPYEASEINSPEGGMCDLLCAYFGWGVHPFRDGVKFSCRHVGIDGFVKNVGCWLVSLFYLNWKLEFKKTFGRHKHIISKNNTVVSLRKPPRLNYETLEGHWLDWWSLISPPQRFETRVKNWKLLKTIGLTTCHHFMWHARRLLKTINSSNTISRDEVEAAFQTAIQGRQCDAGTLKF